MKPLFFSIILSLITVVGFSQSWAPSNYTYVAPAPTSIYVNGYFKQNGTYVQGHRRSKSDGTNHNNWTTTGNSNPYTGSNGSVAKDYSTGANSYGAGRIIYTGPKGGQYYINSNGNKTYVPKRN